MLVRALLEANQETFGLFPQNAAMSLPGFNVLTGVASCVTLSGQIVQLLLTAKGNKHEYRSLFAAVRSIQRFLQALPADGVTPEGQEVLGECSC